MAQLHLRKYGASATITFVLYGITGVDLKTDAAHATGDTKLMKDEGAEADTTNGFTDEGQGYAIVLTATEMQAARLVLYIVDTATKVWLDTAIVIETYGHASAQHPFDLGTASTPQTGDSFGLIGATGSGLTSLATQASVNTIDDFLDTEINAIKTVTDALPNAGALTTIQGDLDNIQTRLPTSLVGGRMDSDVGAIQASVIQAIWDRATSALTTVGSIGKLLVDNINATISSRASQTTLDDVDNFLDTEIVNIVDGIGVVMSNQVTLLNNIGTPTDLGGGATLSANLVAIEAQTDDIGVAGAGLTAIPGVVTVTGNVNGSVASVTGAVGSVTGAVGSVTGAVGSVTGNVGGNVVGSVASVTGAVGSVTGNVGGSVASVTAGVTVSTNNDKTGYALSAPAIQAIWDALTAALTTVGSIGKLLADNVNGSMSAVLARLPAALTGAGNMKADALAVNGSTSAATQLARSAATIVNAAAIAGTLSTTEMTTDLTEVTDDHYNGRIIIWTSGVLLNQATAITDYDGATKKLTYTGITEAPGAGDTFIIV